MTYLDGLAQRTYLDLFVARDYPEQEPEHLSARWFHLLWLLIPAVGIVLFVESIRKAHEKA